MKDCWGWGGGGERLMDSSSQHTAFIVSLFVPESKTALLAKLNINTNARQ